MEKPLVSIIIPTYNRAHLIGETLDSIIAQTYTNWECIVVDDGSSDDTDEVMAGYVEKDPRFKFHKRPDSKPKGANACRNIGLDKAMGEYIVFFDSDDLMTTDHVEVKTRAILKYNVDYVIAKTKNSNGKPYPNHYYAFDKVALTPYNYILQNINWLTPDIIIKKKIIEDIRFNEKLQSGQEYNFFSKLVLKTTSYYFEGQYLTLRRMHEDSVQQSLKFSGKKEIGSFITFWETYLSEKELLTTATKKQILYKCSRIMYNRSGFIDSSGYKFIIEFGKVFGFNVVNLMIMIFLKKYFNRGYYFRNLLEKKAFT